MNGDSLIVRNDARSSRRRRVRVIVAAMLAAAAGLALFVSITFQAPFPPLHGAEFSHPAGYPGVMDDAFWKKYLEHMWDEELQKDDDPRLAPPDKYRLEPNLGENAQLSECGPCDPVERLHWSYIRSSGVVRFFHRGMVMNCCGSLVVTITHEDGRFVIHERDEAGEDGRCCCSCGYNLQVDLPGVGRGCVKVALAQQGMDDDDRETVVWQGEIDLRRGQGQARISRTLPD